MNKRLRYRGGRHARAAGALALLGLLWALSGLLTQAVAASPAIKWGNAVELAQTELGAPYAQVLDAQGNLHLAYITPASGNNEALRYASYTLAGKPVGASRTLVASASQIDDPQLVYDSTGALRCAWIVVTNNGFAVQEATVSAAPAPVVTLYQSTGAIEGLSAGADAQGRVFLTWLDQRSGVENVAYEALRGDKPLGPSRQITFVSDTLFAPQLAVYPDGTMAVTMLHLPTVGLWQLEVQYFAPNGAAEGAPLVLARNLRPSLANVTQSIEFLHNPLAVQLDGQQRLHVVWAMLLDLGEATVARSGTGGKVLNQQTLATSSLNYVSPCLSTRLAGTSRASGKAAPVWVAWADATAGSQAFLSRISDQGTLAMAPQPLVPGLKDSFAPCVGQDSHGTLYTIWQQYDNQNNYGFFIQVQNQPHSEPFWVALGLNRDDPVTQIFFILLGAFIGAAIPAAASTFAVPVGLIVARIGQWLHAPRVLALLVAFVPVWVLNMYVARWLGDNYGNGLPLVVFPVAFVFGVMGVLVLYRQRPIAMKEALPAVGALLFGSYVAAIIALFPTAYVITHVATA
jgi:hypothetical protein